MGKWLPFLFRDGISLIVMASATASARAQFQWPPGRTACANGAGPAGRTPKYVQHSSSQEAAGRGRADPEWKVEG
jgi:hypothetical protein